MILDQQSDTPSAYWLELVNAATMGIDRVGSAASFTGGFGEAQETFGWIDAASPADVLLNQVATLSVYVPMGQMAKLEAVKFSPVEDDLELCGPRAGALLRMILAGSYADLLDEWCRLAADRDQRVPDELLPSVLHHVSRRRRTGEERAVVARVIGNRGRWLAAQNKLWKAYADTRIDFDSTKDVAANAERWATGSKAERIDAIQALRSVDAKQAREVMVASLSEESAADRAAYLKTLAVGLGADDESGLETMLSDRSTQVRDVAADLLSAIQGSALSARMAGRLDAAVQLDTRKGKLRRQKTKFTLDLPASLDEATKRDGIQAKASRGMGSKAAAFSQVVARAPLSWWDAKGLTSDQWIELGLSGDWSQPLVFGWTRAAHLQANTDWSAALIGQVCLKRAVRGDAFNEHWRFERLGELITRLDERQLLSLVNQHLPRDASKGYPSGLLDLLRAIPGPWEVELSRRVLDFVRQAVKDKQVVYDQGLRGLIENTVAPRLSLALCDTAADGWPTDADHWSSNFEELIDRFIRTVGLRQSMHAAFDSTP